MCCFVFLVVKPLLTPLLLFLCLRFRVSFHRISHRDGCFTQQVLESWDAAEDSEVEREKAKKAAEAKVLAEAEAAAAKKSKTQRIEDRKLERARLAADLDDSSDEESDSVKRERLRRTEKEADMRHAEALFGDIGINKGGGSIAPRQARFERYG